MAMKKCQSILAVSKNMFMLYFLIWDRNGRDLMARERISHAP
jgi:hypothetical protein